MDSVKTASPVEYRCPNCDGILAFESGTQNLTCQFCSTDFEVQTVLDYNEVIQSIEGEELEWETYGADSGSGSWSEEETKHLISYICQSCSGEIITEQSTAVTSCPYCDNNIFIPQQFADDFRPDYVIPFQFSKEQAKETLRQYYKGKFLLNPCFSNENHLDEIKGIYVPFWLFDCKTRSDLHYKGTKVRMYTTPSHNVTETKHFSIHRSGALEFQRIPADGSVKMDDTYMEAIEPFDYRQLVDFNPAYLAGFLADKYDVPSEKMQKRVDERIKSTVVDSFTPRGYQSVKIADANVKLEENEVRYALLPVWVLNTRYQGELFTFMMNGQTGKMVGKLPVDKKRFLGLFGGISSLLFLASMLVIWFL